MSMDCSLLTDVMILTEYVEPKPRQELRMRMRSAGRDHIEVSTPIEYRPGKWSNQVLIASRWPTAVIPSPKDPPDDSARSNYLRVKTGGIDLVGIRVSMYDPGATASIHPIALGGATLDATVAFSPIFLVSCREDRASDQSVPDVLSAGGCGMNQVGFR